MVKIFSDPASTVVALAEFTVALAAETIRERGQFTIVLSGGSSPKALYESLASVKFKKSVDWDRVYFFFGDERYVTKDHPDSNYLMVRNALFVPLNISEDNIFPVDTTLPPADSAKKYEETILKHFQPGDACFDLVLLGLGDNSHTASLFPHTTILQEKKSLVKEVYVDELKKYRISLTAPAINAARHIAFLVFGDSKATAVRHILEDPYEADQFPAQLIQPVKGGLDWFLDRASASQLRLQA